MSRFTLAPLASSILCISTVAIATEAFADTQAVQLEPIVVTASRIAQPVNTVPASISIIDQQTIDQSPIQSLPNLLKEEAAFNVAPQGRYGQLSPAFLRGTNSNHTLLLRDGMRLNTATVASQTNTHLLDLSDIERIEILKGPASVQYGSDAIGGVVQLISKTPEKNSVFLTTEAGEDHTYKAIVGADLVQDGVFAQVRGQRLETDGEKIVQSSPVKSAYDQKGYSTKIGTQQEAYGLAAEIEQNKGTADYFNPFNPNELGRYDFDNQLINLIGNVSLSPDLKLSTRLSQFKDNRADILGFASYVETKQQEIDTNLQWAVSPSQTVLLGVEHNKTKAESRNTFKYDNSTTGYYVQHQYKEGDISTQAGLRLEDNEKFGKHTVGQVAGRYQIAPQTSVYANVGTAFNAPTAGQLTPEPAFWGGNPNLKPEKSISYEVGINQQLAQGLDGYMSVYQTTIKDLQLPDASFVWQNLNKARITGTEVGLKWAFDNWFASTEYAYIQSKDKTSDTDLILRPRQNFSLSTGWATAQYGVSTSLVAKGKTEGVGKVNIAGYSTIDLNAFFNVNPNIKVFANVQNVLNKEYSTSALSPTNYYLAGGRLATAGLTLRY